MFDRQLHHGRARFALTPGNGTRQVCLAASFTQWQPRSMHRLKDGSFHLSVPLMPGTYQYKFIVDQRWITDPDHSDWAANPFGTMNSVAHLA